MYLIIASRCENCGGDQAVSFQSTDPTGEDVEKVINKIGWATCIKHVILFMQDEKDVMEFTFNDND